MREELQSRLSHANVVATLAPSLCALILLGVFTVATPWCLAREPEEPGAD